MLINRSRLPVKDIIITGFLPSFIKTFIYRLKGYKIGRRVSIGFGSVIIGKDVVIGNDTKIGFLTVIRGNTIKIGSHVSIGATTILDTPTLEVGDGAKINEQVFVGGMEFPDSKFILGKNTIVMQLTYINTAKPVVIGDDSGIGGHCILFTHSSWLSQFEGYPVDFAPIKIGKSVWLPWRIFVMPGSKIGDGTAIIANSLVHGEIPSRSLAGGSPARVLFKSPNFPKSISLDDKINILKNILNEMVRYFEFYGISCEKIGNIYQFTYIVKKRLLVKKRKQSSMMVQYDNGINNKHGSVSNTEYDLFLSLDTIDNKIRRLLTSKNIMWIDIEKKQRSNFSNDIGDEVALFIKRYGVRLTYVQNTNFETTAY